MKKTYSTPRLNKLGKVGQITANGKGKGKGRPNGSRPINNFIR